MSTDQANELLALVEELRGRVRHLEDIEALRNLKAEYAAACDDNYDPDRLAALFVEDATWESQGLGRYEGREAIREFFRGISGHFVFALHYGLNPQIEVAGDTARARWYLFMPCTVGDPGRAMWRAGLDEEEYVRVQGRWMYKSKKSAPFFSTTFEEGWAKQQFI
ncbi:MAG: nuclear transport factor 2 family protein [Chloroflexi bacterium]|nr:nuclear transport factor 2 family protein [Chloroflexota bacterium]